MDRKQFESLNEKQQRLYLGKLAAERGWGGIGSVAKEYDASRDRVSKGLREYREGITYQTGDRIRRPGGGRKAKTSG